MKLLKLFVGLIIIFNFNYSYAQKPIKYNLNKSNIESVSYRIAPDSTYSISIKLNKKAANEFGKFTKNNIGKLLRIYKSKQIIQEAIIEGEIFSGLILINNLQDSDEVIKYIRLLLK